MSRLPQPEVDLRSRGNGLWARDSPTQKLKAKKRASLRSQKNTNSRASTFGMVVCVCGGGRWGGGAGAWVEGEKEG